MGEPKPRIAATMNSIRMPETSSSNFSAIQAQTPKIFFSIMSF